MKYLPLRNLDNVTSALNFNTRDCRITGACDLYITKAAKADKKLYKDINDSLETKHKLLLQLSASLSPPEVSNLSLDLSRSSPFGPLSQPKSRRTFAYLVATLNASHPDYEFSDIVRPTDFKIDPNLTAVMREINETMNTLRPCPLEALLAPPKSRGTKDIDYGAQTPGGTQTWSPNMWKAIDKEMKLGGCDIFEYLPDEDPFDDSALWNHHYFFFNAAKKRVCYIYIRAQSNLGHSPPSAARSKRGRPVSQSWTIPDTGASKRARFWLGQRAEDVEGEWDEENLGDPEAEADNDVDADEEYDEGGYSSSDSWRYDDNDDDDDEIEKRFRNKSAVRGMSEHIAECMDP